MSDQAKPTFLAAVHADLSATLAHIKGVATVVEPEVASWLQTVAVPLEDALKQVEKAITTTALTEAEKQTIRIQAAILAHMPEITAFVKNLITAAGTVTVQKLAEAGVASAGA